MKDIKHTFRQVISKLHILIFLLIIGSCANQGIPEGGPKDETPPVVVESEPPNYSTNFDAEKIVVTFDEFVVLKGVNQKLIISPPLPEKPEIRLKGKELHIELNNELADSTTYSLNFGDAIVDNNEGNIMQNFRFVFSTGPVLDSLGMSGSINNSFNKQAESEVLIMAYSNLHDTVPQTILPEYVTRSLPDGSFSLQNMRPATYKLFALRDANSNYLFDLPNEAIAYLDTFVTPFSIVEEHTDTIALDTLGNDSVIYSLKGMNYPNDLQMWLFEEKFNKQYLKSSDRKNKAMIKMAFNQAVEDPISIDFLEPDTIKYLEEYHENHDSLFLWLTDSNEYNKDTLRLQIAYIKKDSMDIDYLHRDTLKLGFKQKKKKEEKPKKRKKDDEKDINAIPSLNFTTVPKKGSFIEKGKQLEFTFSEPVLGWDTSMIRLFVKEDTLQVPVGYDIEKNDEGLRSYTILADWQPDNKYTFVADSTAFMSIWGHTNDSVGMPYKTRPLEEYGNMVLNLNNFEGLGILQLMNDKEEVLDTRFIESSAQIPFNHLLPGAYKMKIIYDENTNGEWDTGNYEKKIQPEKVNYFSGEIKVRANWDMELDWDTQVIGMPFKAKEVSKDQGKGKKGRK